ncbi:hypothetical protein CEXT_762041 [Caerostris extrusa]|uniref:Uncharacterized protein n=1 Tax=Caerostris extrusa TaxID=172846 RepID=A0AAV4U5Y8_CAEEX|nr:hypothetical protein CEXT_762041 [Caerostris extrusa]
MTNGHRKVIKRIQNRRRFKDRNVASGKCPISFQELQQPHKTICHQEPVRDLTESALQKFNFSHRLVNCYNFLSPSRGKLASRRKQILASTEEVRKMIDRDLPRISGREIAA